MKNKFLRGEILKLLFELYPDGIERVTLIGIYYQFDKIEEIDKSLEYLFEKKYISKIESPHPYKRDKKITYFKITPEGIDLIDGTVAQDPGVVIPVEA